MINVLGENYFIDLDEVEKYLELSEPSISDLTGNTELKINVVKFELVKLLLETILSEQESFENNLGLNSTNNSAKTSIPFKLAFNSLLNKKLVNHY